MTSTKTEPLGRRQAYSFVHNDQFYVCQGHPFSRKQYRGWRYYDGNDGYDGYTEDERLPLQRFDFSSAQWSGEFPVCVVQKRKSFRYRTRFICDYGMCCAVLGNCAYTFGGIHSAYVSDGQRKYGHAVHELNLETMVWRKLEQKNREDGPMDKEYAGMVACVDGALCVFGGRRQPRATLHDHADHYPHCRFTNELHLFRIETGTWSSPETTGPRPPPCAGFSFTKVDLSRVVMFGGEQGHKVTNEVHILDVENWHWSGAILPSSPADLWPQRRSLHSACVLFDPTPFSASEKEAIHSPSPDISTGQLKPQLFVLWGISDYNGSPIADAWILNVNSISWKPVEMPPVVGQPRICFSLGCYNRSPMEAELVVLGGTHDSHTVEDYLSETPVVGGTTLLYLGMKSLYHSCVDYVAERYELYQPLLQQLLPPHIHTDICQNRDKRANRAHFQVAHL